MGWYAGAESGRGEIMRDTVVFIDTFSGDVADLPRKRRTESEVLKVLSVSPLVSCFDMVEHAWLRNIICRLSAKQAIVQRQEGYPWIRYSVTASGKLLMEESE
jgi:hypothetical protein